MHEVNLDLEPNQAPTVFEKEETAVTVVRDHEPNLSPLDVAPAVFKAGLDRRRENHKALIDWVRAALVEGVDFGTVPTSRGPSKPSLWKPGSEKICGMLGVTATFPTLSDYEQAAVSGVAVDTIILRCELKDQYGNVVAQGVGARSVSKEKGDVNKALKMAEKSGQIDATLRLAGLSEVFTQDLEQMVADGEIVASAAPESPSAPLAPAVQEMLDKAKANREKEQAELDRRKPVDRAALVNAGLVDPEMSDNCEGCGTKLVKRGPIKKAGKYTGRYFMTCPNDKDKSVRHTWRAI